MAEELQALLSKINDEGVKKAEEKSEKIIAEAREKAEKIVKKAEKEAEKKEKNASENAQTMEKRGNAAVQQASRDIKLALRQEIQDRLRNVINECIGDTMTPDFMAEIILKMLDKYDDDKKGKTELEILINKNDLDEMEKLLKGSLAENFRKKPELTLGHDFSSGLKIGFKGDDVFFDISDDAVGELISAYVGPRLTKILRKDEKDD